MSGWPFDDKKNKENNGNSQYDGDVFETKTSYISKVAEFLESGIKEMKKDIKKL
ncbi:MAG TPA: hypothetical protein PK674_01265 [Candidatus Absconditabacterales bacterium]|nr:hypothetical protein [Candidatus Absconditabacterales bacterium]HOQ78762.1 hypothetical protein [Candidatus Absconditabacterales bacterium]HPK27891.1 hypothetical protein [Candidatus Absconditabacterales bacterium]